MKQDNALTNIICQWNDKSMDALYSRYYKVMVAYAFPLLGRQDEAEDAVQDAFFNLWKKRPTFDTDAHLKSYLYSVVRNQAIDRRRKKNQLNGTGDFHDIAEEAPHTFDSEEVYEMLFDAIDALPPRQRDIFLLIMEGKKNIEIAEVLNISLNSVKAQRQTGMKTLRSVLNDESSALLLLLISSYC